MKRLLIKNSLSGVIQTFITLIFTFFVVRLFINQLGTELYGIFSLISIVGNLNILTGLGITTALVKFISEQGRNKQSNIDIATALIIISGILLPLTFAAIYFKEFVILKILSVPEKYFMQCVNLYIYLILANYLLFLGQIFVAVNDSLQMIFVNNIIQLIYNFIYWGSILIVLLLHFSLNEIGVSIFFTAILWFLAMVIVFLKIWGKLRLSGLKEGFISSAKKQIKYGSQIYTSSVVSFFYEPFTKILISNFLGIKEVGFFDIAIKLRNILWNFIAKALQPLFPLLSSIKEEHRIKFLIKDMSHKTAIIVIPVIAVIIININPLINLWIRQDTLIIALISGFITSSYMLAIIYMPVYSFLMSKHPGKTILIQSSNVIVNAIVFFAVFKFIGVYSIIAANVSAIIVSTLICRYYQIKYLNSKAFDNLFSLAKIVISFFIILIPGYLISLQFNNDLLKIIITIFYSLGAFILSFRYLKIVTSEDIDRYFGSYKTLNKVTRNIFLRING